MLFANDCNDIRTFVEDTHSNQEYFCPSCGEPLIVRKGDVRQHHFAHKPGSFCTDTWERSREYDVSAWHTSWQSLFPPQNQEVRLKLGTICHRADVLVDRTVVEFQHSILSSTKFEERNFFYINTGYKVVWLFDLSDLYSSGQIKKVSSGKDWLFSWDNPKKAFNYFTTDKATAIDLFFQFSKEDEDCFIVKVESISEHGFETFATSYPFDKKMFLQYVGLNDNGCLPPYHFDNPDDEQYNSFKQEYGIVLNQQQERAMQSVHGYNLLLAVPGSGKTTVIIDRLAYLIFQKGVDPRSILAITYTTSASNEMADRFSIQFDKNKGVTNLITFKTINALCWSIYVNYCKKTNKTIRTLIDEKQRKNVLAQVYKKIMVEEAKGTDEEAKVIDDEAYEGDILTLGQYISTSKNLMLTTEEIRRIDDDYPAFSKMYSLYQTHLHNSFLMDFDDQMVFALYILRNDASVLQSLRRKFKYISVDEAQDTSKIQHEIIKLISAGNSLFMVGDEDQSIYGFRGAYPAALLNFKYDYANPFILKMETNYRSDSNVVNCAQKFISKNSGRIKKNMISSKPAAEPVEYIKVSSREAQFANILERAKALQGETAFLYRDNETSVVLVDLFLRNGIRFSLRAPEMNFFETKIIKGLIAHLKLAVDDFDYEALKTLCNKGIFYLRKQQLDYAIKNCKRKGISVFDALQEQMAYVKNDYKSRALVFKIIEENLSSLTPEKAIENIMKNGYARYLENNNLDSTKIDLLMMIAKRETTIKGFLDRLTYLETMFSKGFNSSNQLILSTIHSSKGKEYDTVYMVDVYDGRFPSSLSNPFSHSKDNYNGEQEERRLFYVGITRAKRKLFFYSIKDNPSSFLNEVFPELMKEMD